MNWTDNGVIFSHDEFPHSHKWYNHQVLLDTVLISCTQMKSIFLIWMLCVSSDNNSIVEPIHFVRWIQNLVLFTVVI